MAFTSNDVKNVLSQFQLMQQQRRNVLIPLPSLPTGVAPGTPQYSAWLSQVGQTNPSLVPQLMSKYGAPTAAPPAPTQGVASRDQPAQARLGVLDLNTLTPLTTEQQNYLAVQAAKENAEAMKGVMQTREREKAEQPFEDFMTKYRLGNFNVDGPERDAAKEAYALYQSGTKPQDIPLIQQKFQEQVDTVYNNLGGNISKDIIAQDISSFWDTGTYENKNYTWGGSSGGVFGDIGNAIGNVASSVGGIISRPIDQAGRWIDDRLDAASNTMIDRGTNVVNSQTFADAVNTVQPIMATVVPPLLAAGLTAATGGVLGPALGTSLAGTIATGAAAGAVGGATVPLVQGKDIGDIGTGAAVGAIGGGVGGAARPLTNALAGTLAPTIGNTAATVVAPTVVGAGAGALTGGATNLVKGKDFMEGVEQGAITGSIGGAASGTTNALAPSIGVPAAQAAGNVVRAGGDLAQGKDWNTVQQNFLYNTANPYVAGATGGLVNANTFRGVIDLAPAPTRKAPTIKKLGPTDAQIQAAKDRASSRGSSASKSDIIAELKSRAANRPIEQVDTSSESTGPTESQGKADKIAKLKKLMSYR